MKNRNFPKALKLYQFCVHGLPCWMSVVVRLRLILHDAQGDSKQRRRADEEKMNEGTRGSCWLFLLSSTFFPDKRCCQSSRQRILTSSRCSQGAKEGEGQGRGRGADEQTDGKPLCPRRRRSSEILLISQEGEVKEEHS